MHCDKQEDAKTFLKRAGNDISEILIPELTDEQKRKAIEAAKAKDKALEKLEAKRLGEKAKRTAAEQARLKEIITDCSASVR